uniref:Uncharacterized protein n=1 Tax=Rhizophora mucronata TaxID=61149 RepID=A0A2P2IMP5_RHIMU
MQNFTLRLPKLARDSNLVITRQTNLPVPVNC